MTDGTKGGAQRASSLRPRCFGEVDPETATHFFLSIYLSICAIITTVAEQVDMQASAVMFVFHTNHQHYKTMR
jgi:hypothetical protein